MTNAINGGKGLLRDGKLIRTCCLNHKLGFYSEEQIFSMTKIAYSHLPNARMLNIWLNFKNNSPRKRIKNRGMSCNRLCMPMFVV